MSVFGIFADSALTTPFVMRRLQLANEAPAAALDGVFYVGAPVSGMRMQTIDNPGVDPIVVEIGDNNPSGGVAAASVKLATSSGGLNGAIGGDPLNLSHTIDGGVGNAVTVHWRLMPQSLTLGVFDDVFIIIDDVVEFPL
jgi:hypothetical protein